MLHLKLFPLIIFKINWETKNKVAFIWDGAHRLLVHVLFLDLDTGDTSVFCENLLRCTLLHACGNSIKKKKSQLPPCAGSSLAACAGRRGCLGTSPFPHLCFSSFLSCLFALVSDLSRFEIGKRRNSNSQEKPYFWL